MKTRLFLVLLLPALLAVVALGLAAGVTAQDNRQLDKSKRELSADLTLVSISPSSFANGVNMPVTITGSELSTVVSATLGTVELRNLEVISSTQVTALVPWSIVTGTYDLRVISSSALSATLTGAVTVTLGDSDWTSNGPYGGSLHDLVIDPVHPLRMYAYADRSGLWRTEDGGAHWDFANTFPFLERTQIVYSSSDQPPVIYNDWFRSLDYGQTWEEKAPPAFWALMNGGGGAGGRPFIRPDQPAWVYFGIDPENTVEPSGGVYTSTDRGDTWSFMNNTSGLHVTALAFDPDNYDHMILGTRSGQVYTSTNSGATWSGPVTVTSAIKQLMYAPNLYNGKRTLWALTDPEVYDRNDRVFWSENGGETWNNVQIVASTPIYDIAFHDTISGLMWAAVGDGYYSEDGGHTWQPVGAGLDEAQGFAVVPGGTSRQTTTLFAATRTGIYKSTDGGDTWIEFDNGLGANIARTIAISLFNADEAYAATGKGLMHTYDGGRSWQSLPIPIAYYGTSIATDPITNGKVYLGNQRLGLPPTVRVSDDHGRTFTEHAITLPPAYAGQSADVRITPDPEIKGRLLAGLCLGDNPPGPGFIYASANGGVTWTQQATPAGINCISSDLVFDPNNASVVYAGSLNFGLMRSTDRGATWSLLEHQSAGTNILSLVINPDDSNSIYTASFNNGYGSATGVFATHDGGDTWMAMTGVCHQPVWVLKFVEVGTENWLYAATMNALCYLRTDHGVPGFPWEEASGIAGVAAVDGFNAATEDGRVVYYIGTSGGTRPAGLQAGATSLPAQPAAGQNFPGGIYRSMTPNQVPPGIPGWNLSYGSGDGVTALEVFDGQLYAANSSWANGAQVWRSADGNYWTPASELGISSTYTVTNPAITDLVTFKDQLYASVGWGSSEGQIWRTGPDLNWTMVTDQEFGGDHIGMVMVMTVFSDTLYAFATRDGGPGETWRSSTGDPGSWEHLTPDGFGNPNIQNATGAAVLNGTLYVSFINRVDGIQVWRTTNGTQWTQANISGFGDASRQISTGMAIFDGYVYVGAENLTTGGEVWRSDGGDWSQVVGDGFGDVHNTRIMSLYSTPSQLLAVTRNQTTGLQVWTTTDGTHWTSLNLDGFGNVNNNDVLWSNSSTYFANSFYVGTWYGEIWQHRVNFPVYLPLVER